VAAGSQQGALPGSLGRFAWQGIFYYVIMFFAIRISVISVSQASDNIPQNCHLFHFRGFAR